MVMNESETTSALDRMGSRIKRVALAAENLRLLDETQRRAARERLIGEVTGRVRETLDMNTVLKVAVRELRQSLGLPEVVIRLAPGKQRQGQDSFESLGTASFPIRRRLSMFTGGWGCWRSRCGRVAG
jgi:hypothetical protein